MTPEMIETKGKKRSRRSNQRKRLASPARQQHNWRRSLTNPRHFYLMFRFFLLLQVAIQLELRPWTVDVLHWWKLCHKSYKMVMLLISRCKIILCLLLLLFMMDLDGIWTVKLLLNGIGWHLLNPHVCPPTPPTLPLLLIFFILLNISILCYQCEWKILNGFSKEIFFILQQCASDLYCNLASGKMPTLVALWVSCLVGFCPFSCFVR